jgi:hypothetical protein
VIQVQGHSDLIVIYNTLPGHNTYINQKNGTEQKYCHGKWHTCMIKKNHLFSLKTKNILHHTRLYLQTDNTLQPVYNPKLGSGGITINDCLHRTWIFPFPTKVNRSITLEPNWNLACVL